MNEFQVLKSEFETLKNDLKDRNIDEIGVIELRRIKGDLERLHSRNLEIQERIRFDRNIDTTEALNVLNEGNTLYDDIADLLRPVNETVKAKAALGVAKVRSRRELENARNRNQELINMFTADLDRVKTMSQNISDEAVKKLYEQNILGLQENINRLNEVDAYYAGLIANLDKEIETIRFGGKVPELENIDEETKGITKDEEDELRRKAEEANTEKPLRMPGRDEFGGLNNEDTNTESNEESENKGEDEKPLRMPGRDEFSGLNNEGTNTESNEEGTNAESNEESESKDDTTEKSNDEKPEGTENKTNEEDEDSIVDATVKQPKSSLWQKLQPVIESVKIFLLTAIAIHTGMNAHNTRNIINSNTNIETSTETENENSQDQNQSQEQNNQSQEQNSQPDNSISPSQPSQPSTSDEQKPGGNANEDANREEEKITIELKPGETVYNIETGVEVNANGNAVVHNQDGSTSILANRELERNENGNSIVTEDDLKNDGELVLNTLPRTGQEIGEAQARSNMAQQEEDNLDLAVSAVTDDEWVAYFANGPTLH